MAQKLDRILAIDDNTDIRELISFVLQREGFEVFTAKDGISGLKMIKELKPALIILDVMMPEFSGFAVLDAVRSDKDSKVREIPVLMITAKSSTEDIDQALKLGVNSYIVKPFRPVKLVENVKALLASAK